MTPLTVATFKWKPAPGYRSTFTSEHVNILQRMVARNYAKPHRFVCITDDRVGLDKTVEPIPLWPDLADLRSPHGGHNPSCYRRLKVFSAEIESVLGPRFVCIDLDTVIVADVAPLWDRPEDFVCWGETDKRSWYNGSMFLLTAGARRKVWDEFNPRKSPYQAFRAGKFGSDQGWISYKLGKGEATWGRQDGVYSYRVHIAPNDGVLPENARMVMFHGRIDPDDWQAQVLPWVRAAYQ